jgi:hypothetical protein
VKLNEITLSLCGNKKRKKMKNLTIKEIKSIQKVAIAAYKENIAAEGKSRTAEFYANSMMLNYDNAIIEDGLVVSYYNNGCKNIPLMPKLYSYEKKHRRFNYWGFIFF